MGEKKEYRSAVRSRRLIHQAFLELLQEKELLDEGSIVVAEHHYDNKLSESYGGLVRIKEKKYGSIGVDVYIFE